MTLVFIDTESGGLDETVHPLLEVAWAFEDCDVRSIVLPHDVRDCDGEALAINRYDERGLGDRHKWVDVDFVGGLWALLADTTLVASNPSHDERFLLAYARKAGISALVRGKGFTHSPWKHRKIDIASYAMPVLGLTEPVGLAAIRDRLVLDGHDIPAPDHSAVGDVVTLRACFRVLEDLAVTKP
jgi:hypothetical protein